MNSNTTIPFRCTEAAANKIKSLLISADNKNLRLRIYITGGGCNGFQYGFVLDDQTNIDDVIIERKDVELIIDSMSLQYLMGGVVDYVEELEGSRFFITNPNVKTTCGCGSSFNI